MGNYTISIFGNKIFLEILNEIKLFSKFKINYQEDLDQFIKISDQKNKLIIFFTREIDKNFFNKIKINNFPLILATEFKIQKQVLSDELVEYINIPFKILELEKKIISLIARSEFKKNSLIMLNKYIIDKNERKIKKDNLELQLSEKEISFLVLFCEKDHPITKNFVLKNVWNYSSESETHTIETHIHRLRKKILEKFGDKNFIKNNNKGYYI